MIQMIRDDVLRLLIHATGSLNYTETERGPLDHCLEVFKTAMHSWTVATSKQELQEKNAIEGEAGYDGHLEKIRTWCEEQLALLVTRVSDLCLSLPCRDERELDFGAGWPVPDKCVAVTDALYPFAHRDRGFWFTVPGLEFTQLPIERMGLPQLDMPQFETPRLDSPHLESTQLDGPASVSSAGTRQYR
jgi:hypothetical protein